MVVDSGDHKLTTSVPIAVVGVFIGGVSREDRQFARGKLSHFVEHRQSGSLLVWFPGANSMHGIGTVESFEFVTLYLV